MKKIISGYKGQISKNTRFLTKKIKAIQWNSNNLKIRVATAQFTQITALAIRASTVKFTSFPFKKIF